jgi:predicted MPP superfamily phosphohydrolase
MNMMSVYMTTLPAILLLTIAAGVLLAEVYLIARWLWFRGSRKTRPRRRRFVLLIHSAIVIGVLVVLYAVFVEPYWPQINVVRLYTPKLRHTVLRIVQISDTHCDPTARLEPRLPALVNRLNPDIIVFTGDAVNSPDGLALFQKTLAAMNAPLGKYAVRGNWDYRFGLSLFENTGFEPLPLNAVRLQKDGDAFMICGIDYHAGRLSQNALNQLDPETWNLLLYHSPDLIEFLDRQPVDLFLSGHTHGGQVAVPFYGALLTMTRHGKKYEAGLYTVGNIALYVNRGIGMCGIGPRVRFCARPEITLFEIYPAEPRLSENPHGGRN